MVNWLPDGESTTASTSPATRIASGCLNLLKEIVSKVGTIFSGAMPAGANLFDHIAPVMTCHF
jgi:hypothetical protein